MRVFLAFLVWLFSFWTWKDFFLRWVRWSPPSPPASAETTREEHLPSQEGQQESELSRFLASSPKATGLLTEVYFRGDSRIELRVGPRTFELDPSPDMHSGYRDFLEAVASSKVVFHGGLWVSLRGEASCKPMEAFGDALRQSDNGPSVLKMDCSGRSSIRFGKCVANVVLGNHDIQDLRFHFELCWGLGKVGIAEFMACIASPYNLQILKSLVFLTSKLDDEEMEELMKPFKGLDNVLEHFQFSELTSNYQLELISGMLATSTSLKTLNIWTSSSEGFRSGYTSLATALCSNQSL